jgi:hypothetical protein
MSRSGSAFVFDRLLCAVAVACVASIGSVAPAAADDQSDPVPGMQRGVIEGQACSNWERFPFGVNPDGDYLACVLFEDETTGAWAKSVAPVGVREPGTSCDSPQEDLAQAPDGRPLQCSSSSWYLVPRGLLG